MKKSYYLENGLYMDVTTGKTYQPKQQCELCKSYYGLSVHHFIEQQKALRDLKTKKTITPKTMTKEFIEENQKLFTLCSECHNAVHYMSEERFYNRYGRSKSEFIYKC